MGRTHTLNYRIEYYQNDLPHFTNKCAWRSSTDGSPTAANLEKWVNALNRSYSAGGTNYHCSIAAGCILYCFKARIVKQRTGQIVAEYQAPAFAVF
jgi:hypothetical protein